MIRMATLWDMWSCKVVVLVVTGAARYPPNKTGSEWPSKERVP